MDGKWGWTDGRKEGRMGGYVYTCTAARMPHAKVEWELTGSYRGCSGRKGKGHVETPII